MPLNASNTLYRGTIWGTIGPHADKMTVGDEIIFAFTFDAGVSDVCVRTLAPYANSPLAGKVRG